MRFKPQVKFNKKSYPIPQAIRQRLRLEIPRMLDEDVIEVSRSPYLNPLLSIPKKDGNIRLCLNACKINKMMNDRTFPGEIEEIMKHFHGLTFISTWDTVCGYWQVEFEEGSRQYVAFQGRNYQFKQLSFGLMKLAVIYIKAMDQVLGEELLEFTTIYIDNFLITSNS